MAPFIKYSTDYTKVEGSTGDGTPTCLCPVQLARRVPTHTCMIPTMWKSLRCGHEKEFTINMALSQINDPRYNGEVNCYRGLSDLQDTLEVMMKDAQGWVMEVMKELVTIQRQLDLCKKRLECSNAYDELDCQFHLANQVLTHPCPHHSPVQSPLIKPPRVIRAIVPLPSPTRGPAEMSILQDIDPDCRHITRCYRCKAVGHIVSQCPKKRRNRKCTMCGGTHRPAKCPAKARTASPEAVTSVFGKVVECKEMSLLECITLLDCIEYSLSRTKVLVHNGPIQSHLVTRETSAAHVPLVSLQA